ncbi:hypothetical protein H0H87_001496 [Tephrocybe sp. NHM501043]|nr:hypothetical protein H0H87_001496 [Tephrocybe sp. NHM501043]
MGNRKLLPAALHSELTEYSSLIRALRASNTLDVTSHLTKAGLGRGQGSSEELGSNDDDDTDDDFQEAETLEGVERHEALQSDRDYDTDTLVNPPTSSTFQSREASPWPDEESTRPGSQKRKRPSSSPPQQRRRNAWTRWPLLADDVHVPEWSFEDEIGYLAKRALQDQPEPPLLLREAAEQDQGHKDFLDPEDIDSDPPHLSHLTLAASNHLSTILALLVAHTPNRPDSQQNRVEPMDWRAVLDVLSSCGDPSVADLKCVAFVRVVYNQLCNHVYNRIISSVKTRMEALYGHAKTAEHSDSEILGSSRMRNLLRDY